MAVMPQYPTVFLKSFSPRKRAHYQNLIDRGGAYLERAADGSQLLIIADPGGKDEAIWAAVPDADEAKCIGSRAR